MQLINKLIPIIAISFITSCNSELDGKIDNRGGKAYLVNTSKTKAFKFTVKIKSDTDGKPDGSRTEIIELAPGDERHIGDMVIYKVTPHEPQQIVYKSVDELPDLTKPPLPTGYVEIKPETVKQIIKYSYEVTGQLKISSLTSTSVKKRR